MDWGTEYRVNQSYETTHVKVKSFYVKIVTEL
jgi:hypothetical protein